MLDEHYPKLTGLPVQIALEYKVYALTNFQAIVQLTSLNKIVLY